MKDGWSVTCLRRTEAENAVRALSFALNASEEEHLFFKLFPPNPQFMEYQCTSVWC